MAFLGFGASLIIGLHAGNPYITIVLRALTVMFFFYVLGCILAAIGHRIVRENFDNEAENKTPQVDDLPDDQVAETAIATTEDASRNAPQPMSSEPAGIT